MAANRSKVGYQVKICDIFQTNNNLLLSMEIISPFMALGLRTFSGDSLITKNVFIKKSYKRLINQWIPRTIFCIYIYDTISTLTLHLPGNLIPHLRATLGHPDALLRLHRLKLLDPD